MRGHVEVSALDEGTGPLGPRVQRLAEIRRVSVSRVNQGGKRDNQDGKFFDGVIFEDFGSDLTR